VDIATLAALLFGTVLMLGLLFWAGLVRTALFLLTPTEVGLLRARQEFAGQQIAYLHQDQRRLLATLLALQALFTSGLAVVWAMAIATHPYLWPGMLAVWLLAGLLGYALPHRLAPERQYDVLQQSGFGVLVAYKLMGPAIEGMVQLTSWLVRRQPQKGVPPLPQATPATEESTAQTEETGPLDERDLLRSIARFSSIPTRQVMSPRRDMETILATATYHQVLDTINKTGYSRFPVIGAKEDNVVGILYVKDLLPFIEEEDHFVWQAHLRTPLFVSEQKPIDVLLREFQTHKTHLALVVDEYGGLRGLATLEDVLEEIVGDIRDEFDEDERPAWALVRPGVYEAEGRTSINDFCRAISLDPAELDNLRGTAETLAGLLLEVAGHLPRQGERVEAGPLSCTIISASARQVKKVRIKIQPEQ